MASISELQARSLMAKTVIVKPVPKHIYSSVVCLFLEKAGQITEFKRIKNKVFADFSTSTTAILAVEQLNNTCFSGSSIPVTVELYKHKFADWRAKTEFNAPDAKLSTNLQKNVVEEKQQQKVKENRATVIKKPKPTMFTGRYLLQLLKIVASSATTTSSTSSSPTITTTTNNSNSNGDDNNDDHDDDNNNDDDNNSSSSSITELIKILTMKRKNHTKEICESFAATRALFDFDHHHHLNLRRGNKNVVAIIPGDGCRPYTSAALMLQVPKTWTVFSVDPAMGKKVSKLYHPRLHCIGSTLESLSFNEPPLNTMLMNANAVVILAVHSHAPLQTFWSSLQSLQKISHIPKIAISIPCCGDHGWIQTKDLQYQYVDGEIKSQGSNTVLVYSVGI